MFTSTQLVRTARGAAEMRIHDTSPQHASKLAGASQVIFGLIVSLSLIPSPNAKHPP